MTHLSQKTVLEKVNLRVTQKLLKELSHPKPMKRMILKFRSKKTARESMGRFISFIFPISGMQLNP